MSRDAATGDGDVLIVTAKFDPHADHVLAALRARGVGVLRLNTDDFHEEMRIASDPEGGYRLRDRWGRAMRFPGGARSVWCRKPVDPAPPPGVDDAATRRLIAGETAALLEGLAAERAVRWVNNPHDNAMARHKLPQLRLARTLGLRLPRTLVTNDPDEARAFGAAVGGRVLCKALREVGFGDDQDWHSLFARAVPPEIFERHVADVANCPTLFQEYTDKAFELRITIIGAATFCCRIDSQAVAGAETDWRRVDPFSVPHRMVELDAGVEVALRRMLAHYGLCFGAFDMIVTPAGEHVFLELNPNGQWLWMELITGAAMAEAMATLLAG